MGHLYIDRDAEQDLEVLWTTDPDTAATIVALLEEIDGSPKLVEMLTASDYGHRDSDLFDVQPVGDHQRRRRNVWRLKLWNIEEVLVPYRILYALDIKTQRYYVLGVIHRDQCYDLSSPRVAKLVRRYEALGIADLPY